MFERFSMQARQAVVYAENESRLLNHGYIGTEHLLLGLLREPDTVAGRSLATLDILLDEARGVVKRLVGRGDELEPGPRQIPFTPGAKKVLEQSLREAIDADSGTIETEHLLLALVNREDSVAIKVLRAFEITPTQVRQAVAQRLAERKPRPHGDQKRAVSDTSRSIEFVRDAMHEHGSVVARFDVSESTFVEVRMSESQWTFLGEPTQLAVRVSAPPLPQQGR